MRRQPDDPLRVNVLVDLNFGPSAGGHVKCWERLAQAAAKLGVAGGLDLTVHFSGCQPQTVVLSDTVRYRIHRPVFSTSQLPFLSHVPDHTDLAPFHPGLARWLDGVVHTTDAFFAYARTAALISRLYHLPLVNSVHTDTPRYAQLFTAATVRRLFGPGEIGRVLLERLRVDLAAERDMLRKLQRHQKAAAFSFVSAAQDLDALKTRVGAERAGLLRRGIDRDVFDPGLRNRAWLAERFGISEDVVVILCVGRINAGKNVLDVAAATRGLLDQGARVHLICAGEGDQKQAVLRMLGTAATCPGVLTPEILARVYACADIFAMPSRIEIHANVVMEALASGLPALVSAEGGMGRLLREGETGWTVGGVGAQPWVEAMGRLAGDGDLRRRLSLAARASAVADFPSWTDVLCQDLLPVWRRVAGRAL